MLRWTRSCASRLRLHCAASRSWSSGNAPQSLQSELRVGVLGLGAIGTIFFTRLGQLAARQRLQVDALVKPAQFRDWMGTPQLKLHGQSETDELQFEVDTRRQLAVASNAPSVRVRTLESAVEDARPLDVLLVAVKAYDSAAVIRGIQESHGHLLREDALCVLLQNGLGEVPEGDEGNEQDGGHLLFANGVTFVGGRVLSFGEVLTSGLDAGMTYLAPIATKKPMGTASDGAAQAAKMQTLAQVCQAAGINCQVLQPKEMQAMLWRKLIVNAAINPLASLLDAPNMSVANSEGSRLCVKMIVKEAFAVAQQEQVPLSSTEEELVKEVLDVAHNTGSNVCSMLADLRRGSRTEIDAITGRIVAGGKRHGIPTPTNELLLSLIKALENEGTRASS